MAFQPNAQRNNDAGAGAQNDNWKAQGFLNLYLPGQDGKRMKLGAIPLKDSKVSEQKLRAWLEEDPTRVEKVKDALLIEYKPAQQADTAGFKLD